MREKENMGRIVKLNRKFILYSMAEYHRNSKINYDISLKGDVMAIYLNRCQISCSLSNFEIRILFIYKNKVKR